MRLLFLGTGSPEGNPSPFCNCINCQYVRRKGGRNIRLQASLLINDDLLIDFGPDVIRTFNNSGLSMSKLKYVLITHCHYDHFYAGNFFNRLIGPRTTRINDLDVYGPERIKVLSKEWVIKPAEQKLHLHQIEPLQNLNLGPYHIKTFRITQDDKFAGRGMCFAITHRQKTIFYGVDTYLLPKDTWQAMKGLVFDTVILDETFGYKNPPDKNHHNISLFLKTVKQFKTDGLTNPKTKFYTQHLSHHNPPHDKLVQIMAKHKISVPYDGLEILC